MAISRLTQILTGYVKTALFTRTVQWLVAIGLLYLVIANIDARSFTYIIASIPFWFYGTTVALGSLALVLATIRWKILSPSYRFSDLLHLNFIGFFFAFALPSTITGDVTRVALAKGETQDKVHLSGAVLADRLLGFLSLIVLLLLGGPGSALGKHIDAGSTALIASLVIVVIPIVLTGLVKNRDWITRRLPEIVSKTLNMLITSLSIQTRNAKGLILAFLISVMSQLIFAFSFMIAGTILGAPLAFGDYVICSAIVQVAGLLPVSVAGVGVKDVTLVTIIVKSGVDLDTATAIALSGYPGTIILVGLGYIALLHYRSSGRIR